MIQSSTTPPKTMIPAFKLLTASKSLEQSQQKLKLAGTIGIGF